jgi:hypothetical protein
MVDLQLTLTFSDLDREALAGEEMKTATDVKKYQRRLKELSATSQDRAKVEKLLKAAEKKHKTAQENLNAYNFGDAGKKMKHVGKAAKGSRGEVKEGKEQEAPSSKL